MSWKWSTLLVLVTFTCLMVVYYGRAIHKDTARIAQAQQDRLLHIPLRTIKSNYVQEAAGEEIKEAASVEVIIANVNVGETATDEPEYTDEYNDEAENTTPVPHDAQNQTAKPQDLEAKRVRLMQREKTVKTLDFFIKNKDMEGLCKTIDDFVLNPANKPPLPVVQNLSDQFQIPSHIKDIPPTDEAEMDGRRKLLTLGCEAAVVYRQYKHMFWKNQDLLFDLLRKLQSDMMAGKPLDLSSQPPTVDPLPQTRMPCMQQQVRTIFMLDEYKVMSCLPLKTGTTNWQRALISLLYVKDGEPLLSPSDVAEKNVFKSLPRYSQRYTPDVFLSGHHSRAKLPCIRRALKIRTNSPDFTRWINVRHPFSRLLSAWRQKFDKAYSGVESYYKYVDKIRLFEDKERKWKKDATHVVSLEAFLSYVANVASDHYYNEHWRSYWYSCSPCAVKYSYVTKQESSASDAAFLFKRLDVNHLTYLPGIYSDSPLLQSQSAAEFFHNVPTDVIKKLYNIYFMDFLMYNYTVDDYLSK